MVHASKIHARLPADEVDVSVLGEELTFRNGRVARNRFLKAALTERLSSYDPVDPGRRGIPPQNIINLYDKWGHGGFGMILTGNVCVDPYNLEAAGNAIFCKENDTPALRAACKEWVTAMKQDGALAIVQLSHAGRQTPKLVNPHPFSCSDVQLTGTRRFMAFGKPIPLSIEQIKSEVVDRFVYAAKFAFELGFDGVQLHAAHGYLLSQFMSPLTNKRTDQYGGSLENRMRIVREIYQAIRDEIHPSTGFLVGIKTNSVEFQDNGLKVDDAKLMCKMMEDWGFDFVELSGGNIERFAFQHLRDSTRQREAFFLDFAAQIRPVFKKTIVYVTGGFRTAPAMVKAVTDGTTDGIGLGRPITAEPDLPAKILRGECFAAADAKLDQDDFVITSTASLTQMGQMGRRSYVEIESICDDITDFSHPKEAENYKKAVLKFLEDMRSTVESEQPEHVVFEYANIVA